MLGVLSFQFTTNIHRPKGEQSEPTYSCMNIIIIIYIVISKTVRNCNTLHNILIHLYLKLFFRNIGDCFDVSTPSNGQMQIRLRETLLLTVEEKNNKVMEPRFMEVMCIWAGLTGLTQGERGLASYIGERICVLKIAHFHA